MPIPVYYVSSKFGVQFLDYDDFFYRGIPDPLNMCLRSTETLGLTAIYEGQSRPSFYGPEYEKMDGYVVLRAPEFYEQESLDYPETFAESDIVEIYITTRSYHKFEIAGEPCKYFSCVRAGSYEVEYYDAPETYLPGKPSGYLLTYVHPFMITFPSSGSSVRVYSPRHETIPANVKILKKGQVFNIFVPFGNEQGPGDVNSKTFIIQGTFEWDDSFESKFDSYSRDRHLPNRIEELKPYQTLWETTKLLNGNVVEKGMRVYVFRGFELNEKTLTADEDAYVRTPYSTFEEEIKVMELIPGQELWIADDSYGRCWQDIPVLEGSGKKYDGQWEIVHSASNIPRKFQEKPDYNTRQRNVPFACFYTDQTMWAQVPNCWIEERRRKIAKTTKSRGLTMDDIRLSYALVSRPSPSRNFEIASRYTYKNRPTKTKKLE